MCHIFESVTQWHGLQDAANNLPSCVSDLIDSVSLHKFVLSSLVKKDVVDAFEKTAGHRLPVFLKNIYLNVSNGMTFRNKIANWQIVPIQRLDMSHVGVFSACDINEFFENELLELDKKIPIGTVLFAGCNFRRYLMILNGPLTGAIIQQNTDGCSYNRHICSPDGPKGSSYEVLKSIISNDLEELTR